MIPQITPPHASITPSLTAMPLLTLVGTKPANDMLSLAVNIVGCRTDQTLLPIELSWEEFRNDYLSRILDEQVRSDKDGLAWIPATFKDQSAGRTLSNVDALTCIVLDVDHGMKFDDAAKLVKDWGYEAVLHTSYSHTAEVHKFRVILPLSQPIEASQAKPLFDLMQATFDNKLDPACLEASRLFYLPSCPIGAKEHFQFEHVPGHLLSLENAVETAVAPHSSGTTVKTSITKLAGASVSFSKATPGKRHTTLTQLVGTLLVKGLTAEMVMSQSILWNASLCEPLTTAEVEKTVMDICTRNKRQAAQVQSDCDKAVELMNTSYAWLNTPMAIYRLHDGAIVSGSDLMAHYANRRVTINLDGSIKTVTCYEAWLKSPNRREHEDVIFRPGQPEIVNNCVNLWKSWGAIPAAGEVTPWIELLDYVFEAGTIERRWMEQWLAYPLQHPGTKLHTCTVIWSTQQGVGKSMLGNTVGRLYGQHAKTITAKELHSKYNGWAQETLFVLGEENSSGDHRADSNKLKELITGKTVFIEEKYFASKECQNQMNFLFTSNHPDAFHLESSDRRYFVWSIDKPPMPGSFYDAFIAWRDSENGLPALMAHLLSVDLTGFDPHGEAPMTAAKTEMKEMSKTELERWTSDALSDHTIDERFLTEVMATKELVRLFQLDTGAARSSDTALTKALRKQTPYVKRRINVGKGMKTSVISLRNHEHWEAQSDAAWVTEFNKYSSVTLV